MGQPYDDAANAERPGVIEAVRKRDLPKLAKLLQAGVDPDAKVSKWSRDEDMRGIHIAAYYGYVEEMALLLKHGADVNRKITDSYTPLHYACFFANHGAARLLVAAGADPLYPDQEGSTPISLAVQKDDKELVEILRGGTAAAGGGAVD